MIECQFGEMYWRRNMPNISIVTAFYDIGRGDWTPNKGFPHYLQRSKDVYLERFSRLLKLKNDITIYTSPDLVDEIQRLCDNSNASKTNIISWDIFNQYRFTIDKIKEVQKSHEFQSRVHSTQKLNPEYWNSDYVLVTNLKAAFVYDAIARKLPQQNTVAWIDFGYMRSDDKIPSSMEWNYNFDPDKIHLFNYKDYDDKPIEDIIYQNDVYILGATMVADKQNWWKMHDLMLVNQEKLFKRKIVDDDQGLELMCYLDDPDSFELHRIPDHQLGFDPFVTFSNFNETI